MSTNPEPWHAPLAAALQAALGELEDLRTRWYPLPPGQDWMVSVDDGEGRRRGTMITQLFTPITEMLFFILEEETAGADAILWLALPTDADLTPSRIAFLAGMDVLLIPCTRPHFTPGLPCRAQDWHTSGED